MLSYSLKSLKIPHNYRATPGETLEQEVIFLNDSSMSWFDDTCFVFVGNENLLELPEEIFIGAVPSMDSVGIQISIKIPELAELKADQRFQIEYEFRHS